MQALGPHHRGALKQSRIELKPRCMCTEEPEPIITKSAGNQCTSMIWIHSNGYDEIYLKS